MMRKANNGEDDDKSEIKVTVFYRKEVRARKESLFWKKVLLEKMQEKKQSFRKNHHRLTICLRLTVVYVYVFCSFVCSESHCSLVSSCDRVIRKVSLLLTVSVHDFRSLLPNRDIETKERLRCRYDVFCSLWDLNWLFLPSFRAVTQLSSSEGSPSFSFLSFPSFLNWVPFCFLLCYLLLWHFSHRDPSFLMFLPETSCLSSWLTFFLPNVYSQAVLSERRRHVHSIDPRLLILFLTEKRQESRETSRREDRLKSYTRQRDCTSELFFSLWVQINFVSLWVMVPLWLRTKSKCAYKE